MRFFVMRESPSDTYCKARQLRSLPEPHIPIFVLGMSRSGKTLVESLLAQADHVSCTGESKGWDEMVNSTCQRFGVDGKFPEYLAQISNHHAEAIRCI